MKTILVTGGCGYIGSHTIVDLLANGYEVVSIDNNSRSTTQLLQGAEEISGRKIINYQIDLCDFDEVRKVFQQHSINGIIHFAAFKAVNESVEQPLLYYHNNLTSQINILRCAEDFHVQHFVFSSSCSVYGNADVARVTEETPLQQAESPYGRTKQMGEDIIIDTAKASVAQFILLRYFNPVGAHPSGIIGEVPFGRPSNLIPAITQFAAGKLSSLKVYGGDYDTRDGSCIRDFIHVCDIAHAHTLAMDYLFANALPSKYEVLNLGTGNGVTVLETLHAFEKVTGIKLNYEIVDRRAGDIVAVYANNDKAKNLLGWNPVFNLEDMMRTAWQWELSTAHTVAG